MPSNTALQTDKDKLSCLLHVQKPHQLAFAAELGRWTDERRQRQTGLRIELLRRIHDGQRQRRQLD